MEQQATVKGKSRIRGGQTLRDTLFAATEKRHVKQKGSTGNTEINSQQFVGFNSSIVHSVAAAVEQDVPRTFVICKSEPESAVQHNNILSVDLPSTVSISCTPTLNKHRSKIRPKRTQ